MKSTLMRITLISLLCIVIIPNFTSAEIRTFVKEYTYQESEYDSRNSSRTIALREVKKLLLDELGTYLESVKEVQNFQLTKDQIVTLTAGIVQTEIIDEKWDGRIYRLRARIAADSGSVIKSIDALRSDREKTKELDTVWARADEQLREIDRIRQESAAAIDEVRAKKKVAYDDIISRIKAIEWFENGLASGMSGNHNKAIDNFTLAINLDPKFAIAFNNRGNTYINLGNHVRAIENYNKAIEINPEYAEAFGNRGVAHYNLGNHRQAIDDFNKVIKLNPNYAHVYYNRGLAYGNLGNHRQAIEDYNKVIELNPKLAIAYYNRGNTYINLGNHGRAIEDYNKALEINPEYAEAFGNRGVANYNLGNHRQAIEDFNKVIELNANYAHVYYIRGNAYGNLGNHRQAIEDYNKAIELNPKYAEAYYSRDLAHRKLNEQDRAKGHESFNLQELIREAEAFSRKGNYEEAIKMYTLAISLSQNNMILYQGRGIAHEKLANFKSALNDLNRAIELNPNNVLSYMLRANNYVNLGNDEMAIRDYSHAIRLAPDNADAYHFRGFRRVIVNDTPSALEDFAKSCELGNTEACKDASKLKKTITDVASSYEPESRLYAESRKLRSVYWLNKGIKFEKAGDYQEAIDAFTKAIELNPQYAEAYSHKSEAYKRLNKRRHAYNDVAKASDLKGPALGKAKVYIHYAREKDKKIAEDFAVFLKRKGYASVETEKIRHGKRDIRYFHDEDEESALLLKQHLDDFIVSSATIAKFTMQIKNLSTRYPHAQKGAIEMWVFF